MKATAAQRASTSGPGSRRPSGGGGKGLCGAAETGAKHARAQTPAAPPPAAAGVPRRGSGSGKAATTAARSSTTRTPKPGPTAPRRRWPVVAENKSARKKRARPHHPLPGACRIRGSRIGREAAGAPRSTRKPRRGGGWGGGGGGGGGRRRCRVAATRTKNARARNLRRTAARSRRGAATRIGQ